MKKLVLSLCLVVLPLLLNADFDELSLRDLSRLAAQDVGKNIVVPDAIQHFTVSVNLEDHQNKGDLFSLFRNVLFGHHLKLVRRGKAYFVEPDDTFEKDHEKKIKLYAHKYCFSGVTADDAKLLMSVYSGLKFKYLPMTDCLVYRSPSDLSKEIHTLLHSTDRKLRARVVKLTIFAVNRSKLKNTGFFTDGLQLGVASFVDSHFGDGANGAVYSIKAVGTFKAMLKYITELGAAEIIQSPVMLLTNGVPSSFKAVKNVPYLNSSATVDDSKTTTTQQYSYKDVGLQIKITPKIKPSYMYLTLDLVSEELLSMNDDRPITQKIAYQNSVILRKGRAVLLTGFKKLETKHKTQDNIFSYIPFIGRFLRGHDNVTEKLDISILIEVI